MNYIFKEVYLNYSEFIKDRTKGQSYRSSIYIFEGKIIPFFGELDIRSISKLDVLNFQHHINKFHFSNNTKKNIHYNLVSFFDFCIKFYDLESNVAREVGLFKLDNIPIKHDFYTPKEFKHFIKNVDSDIYRSFFEFMFYTGCRPGEAMALKFSDIHGNYVSINKTIDEHGSREIGSPKTKTSYRDIIIDKKLLKSLIKLRGFYNCNGDLFVFGGLKPLAPTTINRYKLKACEKANLRPIKLHEFRHSHATLLISKNIMINEVSRRLGHSKTSTTLDIYSHTNLEQEKKVLRTLSFLHFM